MFAKNLETTLTLLAQKGDVSGVLPAADIAERFEVLRLRRKLPYGCDKRAQPLTSGEIAAAATFSAFELSCSRRFTFSS